MFIAALSLWLRRPRRKTDRVARGYARFCAALERAGLPREPWEGPQSFAQRAGLSFPRQAAVIDHVASLYIELRYGPGSSSPRHFLDAVRDLPRFDAVSHT